MTVRATGFPPADAIMIGFGPPASEYEVVREAVTDDAGVMMHPFWSVTDPMMAQVEQAMFMKNVAMLGGALLVAYFGAGPGSLDARHGRGVR